MSDLTDRLRARTKLVDRLKARTYGEAVFESEPDHDCAEAAAEIERRDAEIEGLKAMLHSAHKRLQKARV
jgi:hypothetical protein